MPGSINPFRWKGLRYERNSKFYNLGNRFYNSELMRWVTPDSPKSVPNSIGTAYGLNRYIFARNNPLAVSARAESCLPEIDLVPETKTYSWWDYNGWIVMIFVGIVLIAAAAVIGGAGAGAGACGSVSMSVAGMAALTAGTQALVAALSAALIGAGIGFLSGMLSAQANGATDDILDNALNGAIQGACMGFLTGALSGFVGQVAKVISMPRSCFIAGTIVKTKDGDKKIEDVEVDEEVWSYDEKTGKSDWKKVVRLFRNETLEWYKVNVDGKTITCTAEHPFYVVGKGFVPARSLKISDKCLKSDGKKAIIKNIEVEHLSEPETTYNFEVADFHTYYVSEKGILVHNKCAYDYLDDALGQNGYTRKDIPDLVNNSPNVQWKHTWSEGGTKYQVRIHAGNSQYTNSNYIFRVARQASGKGWQYLGLNRTWYHTSVLSQFYAGGALNPLYNEFAAIMTHLPI